MPRVPKAGRDVSNPDKEVPKVDSEVRQPDRELRHRGEAVAQVDGNVWNLDRDVA